MRAIFVSYRRSDTQGEAGRLFDDLVAHFGEQKVFMDVAGIEAGADFRKAIEESIANCGVLLVVIGPAWVAAKDESGRRRLDDPADFVGVEVGAALRREIPVIPVLVRGAMMPRPEELPENLKELAYRNCVELTHARWKSDVQLLLEPLRRLVGNSGEVKTAGSPARAEVPNLDAQTSRFDTFTLQRVRKALALDIGPIADVVVKRAAAACNSTDELYAKVAEEIESPKQRDEFLRRVNGDSAPVLTSARANAAVAPPGVAAQAVPSAKAPTRKKTLVPALIAAGILLLVGVVFAGRKMIAPSAPDSASTPNRAASQPDSSQPAAASKSETKPELPAAGPDGISNAGSGCRQKWPKGCSSRKLLLPIRSLRARRTFRALWCSMQIFRKTGQ